MGDRGDLLAHGLRVARNAIRLVLRIEAALFALVVRRDPGRHASRLDAAAAPPVHRGHAREAPRGPGGPAARAAHGRPERGPGGPREPPQATRAPPRERVPRMSASESPLAME